MKLLPPSELPPELAAHSPDAHWALPGASCSLWWRSVPSYPDHRLGLIGHYRASDGNAAPRLLAHACEQLAAQGCTLVVGPMDGNTWRKYRFVTERGTEPAFFLEPDNPDEWPRQLVAAGFTPFATYTSALNPTLAGEDQRVKRAAERMELLGVRIRPLDSERFDDELRRIYQISIASFRGNFLYTPIEENEFRAMYHKVQPILQTDLALIAERDGRAIGFLFALPDVAQAQRGGKINTVIIKTVAVLPDCGCAGLGGLLVARSQAIARALGYSRAIHALMHESNRSQNISARYAQTMRRYTLFAKPLRP